MNETFRRDVVNLTTGMREAEARLKYLVENIVDKLLDFKYLDNYSFEEVSYNATTENMFSLKFRNYDNKMDYIFIDIPYDLIEPYSMHDRGEIIDSINFILAPDSHNISNVRILKKKIVKILKKKKVKKNG